MRIVCGLALLSLVAACEEPVMPPPPVRDGGGDVVLPPPDSGQDAGPDAMEDAASSDGDVEAGPRDGGVDARVQDAGPPPIPPEQLICEDGDPIPTCDGCSTGTTCTESFCGGRECVPGRRCEGDEDCGASMCIVAAGARDGVCAPLASCTIDGECQVGFACEGGACVDRRIPCGFRTSRCPRGMICGMGTGTDRAVCVWGMPACDRDQQCDPGAQCVDLDGSGSSECLPQGLCRTNDDCDAGESCGVDPQTGQSRCVIDGACRGTTCPDGFECADVGQGARCVATGGTCSRNDECPPQAICGAILPRDPLRCLTFDEDAS